MPPKKVKQPPPRKGLVFSQVPPWAMDRVTGDSTAVLVLFALGTFRNNTTGHAFPSQTTLRAITQLGERAQREALHRLVKAGALYVHRHATNKKPAVYLMPDHPLGGNSTGSQSEDENALDRQFAPSRAAESADKHTTEHTTGSTTGSTSFSCSSNALAQSSSGVGATNHTQRRSARQGARPRRVGAGAGLVEIRDLMTLVMDRAEAAHNAKRGAA